MAVGRRRSGCLIVVVVLLVLGCGMAVAADRAIASTVDSRLTDAVAGNLRENGTPAAKTDVETVGFPFLTQVVSGQFDGADIHLTKVTTKDGTIENVDLRVRDLDIPQDVLTGVAPHDITAGSVVGTGRLTVAEIASRLNLQKLELRSAGATLTASLPVEIPVVGTIPVTAEVTPRLNGNQITFDVGSVTANGITVPTQVIDDLTNQFSQPVVLDLPFAVKLEKVTASGGILAVTGSARNVALAE